MNFVQACKDGDIEMAKKLLDDSNINKELCKACKYGHIEITTWLYELGANNFTEKNISAACKKNNVEILKWLLSTGLFNGYYDEYSKIDNSPIEFHVPEMLRLAIKKGHLEVTQFLFDTFGKKCGTITDDLFSLACCSDNIELAKLLCESDFVANNIGRIFNKVCIKGNLKIAEWIYDTHQINICGVFINSCSRGNIKVAKWLYSLQKVNIDKAFIASCSEGKIEIVQWLYELSVNKSKPTLVDGFVEACTCGQIETAKWIYSVCKDLDINEAFFASCQNGNLDLVKWLYSLDSDPQIKFFGNVCDAIDAKFISACRSNYLELAKWLHSIGANIRCDDDQAFIGACGGGNFEIAKWLYSLGVNVHSKRDKAFIGACKRYEPDVAIWLRSLEGEFDDNLISELCDRLPSGSRGWVYELFPKLLERDLFIVDNNVLIEYGLNKNTIRLIESIKNKPVNETCDEDDTIDDILIHSLCRNNMVVEYFKISHNFPYVTVIAKGNEIVDYSIDRQQLKSSRNI